MTAQEESSSLSSPSSVPPPSPWLADRGTQRAVESPENVASVRSVEPAAETGPVAKELARPEANDKAPNKPSYRDILTVVEKRPVDGTPQDQVPLPSSNDTDGTSNDTAGKDKPRGRFSVLRLTPVTGRRPLRPTAQSFVPQNSGLPAQAVDYQAVSYT